MATAVQSMHSPAPSTAPVLEFVCLFTRDLRRKQKRWQDGRLKYHTFNKRVMVYDDRGNFVGDTHWREDYDLNDGDELELERGGVTVQIAECAGSRDQDLSELVDKRAQEKAERQAAALARRPRILESAGTPQVTIPHFQLLHKPLHHLIGTPTGHHGRALVPAESPYEERQKMAVSPQDTTHPAKRRKREASPPSKGGYAQSLFGAALTLSGTPTSTPLMRSRPPKASLDPDHHEEVLDSSLSPIHRTAFRKERPARAPQTELLGKMSREPEALVQDENKVRFSSLPVGNGPGPDDGHNSTCSTKRLGLKRKGGIRSRVVEDDSLRPISSNLDAIDLDPAKSNSARPKGGHNSFGIPLASSSRNAEYVPLISRSKASVQDQDPASVSRIGNEPKMAGFDQESRGLGQGQTTSEPRTELRFKPRKKRGLLMVSEKLEIPNSPLLRTAKGQIDDRDLFTPLGDKTERHLDRHASYRDGSSEIENNEDEYLQRNKKTTANSIEGINKSPSDLTQADPYSYSNAVHDDYNKMATLNASHLPRRPRPNEREPVLTRSASSTKWKSTKRQNTETRRQTQDIPISEERRDTTAILIPGIQDEREHLEMTSHSYDKTNGRRTMMPKPAHEDAALAGIAIPPKRRRPPSKKERTSTEDNMGSLGAGKVAENAIFDEEFTPSIVPAPRLAHLGRTSIRSREVIGFIVDGEDIHGYGGLPQSGDEHKCDKGSLSSNLPANRLGVQVTKCEANCMNMAMADDNQVHTNDHCQGFSSTRETEITENYIISRPINRQDTSAADTDTTSVLLRKRAASRTAQISATLDMQAPVLENTTAVSQPRSRIVVNPATRGKKAAKPSDAAGQVPQCPFPSEAAAGNPSNSGKHEINRRSPSLENRTKEATLASAPGFVRANGGPWSREAHDLFEFTRPP